MKRIAIFAALAALLLLTACQKTPAADPVAPPVTDTQTTQTDTAPEPGDEEEIEEIPTQVVPSTDSASPLEPVPAEITATGNTVEEGIEDSVGYSYVLPVFSGFDGAQAVTDFYNAFSRRWTPTPGRPSMRPPRRATAWPASWEATAWTAFGTTSCG